MAVEAHAEEERAHGVNPTVVGEAVSEDPMAVGEAVAWTSTAVEAERR
jgi:hypothetical protein